MQLGHCTACSYWVPREGQYGHCRRRSPLTVGWPETRSGDWCGDYNERPTPESQALIDEIWKEQRSPESPDSAKV